VRFDWHAGVLDMDVRICDGFWPLLLPLVEIQWR